jgi:OPA family glycerol-3-phosphate transporter-like MFS transporter
MGDVTEERRLAQARRVTLGTLFGGYVGYYFCRSHLSVATPLILDEFGVRGVTKENIGAVVTIGVATYALGKLVGGPLADRFGGRRLFLAGMAASAAITAVAAALGAAAGSLVEAATIRIALGVFAVLWGLNRFAQSMGWPALVRVVGRWFPVGRHATVMGVLSLSFLLGDALVRLCLGGLIEARRRVQAEELLWLAEWPLVFFAAAAALTFAAAVTAWLLRESPADLGLPEPAANPINVYGTSEARRPSVWELLRPLLASRLFWLVCGMSFGLTLIRETVNFWTPTYLTEVAGLDSGEAALASVLPPLAGAAASVAAGWLSDRLGGRHGRVILPSLALLMVSLALLAWVGGQAGPGVAVGLVTAASFFLVGPYTYLAGVIALDLGGKTGSSTASAFIDYAGYVPALLSGFGVGWLAEHYRWPAVFAVLFGVGALTAAVAALFLVEQERRLSAAAARKPVTDP